VIKFHPKGADVGPQKLKILQKFGIWRGLNRSDPITANSSNMRVYTDHGKIWRETVQLWAYSRVQN